MSLSSWRKQVARLKQETDVLYLAYQDPGTPLIARVVLLLVVGYSLSPIDLIPDFIPVLGYLDDLVLVPLGIWLARRLVPDDVLARCRHEVQAGTAPPKPLGRIIAVGIILIWLLGLAALIIALVSRSGTV